MTSVLRFTLAMLAVVLADRTFEIALSAQEQASFQRRDESTEEELRQQLQKVPEVGFNHAGATEIHRLLRTRTQPPSRGSTNASPPVADLGFRYYEQLAKQHRQADFVSLPWRKSPECLTGKESAEWLQGCSINLRACLQRSGGINGANVIAGANLKAMLKDSSLAGQAQAQAGQQANLWTKPDCIPTLVQMLQVENVSVRELLVEMLSNIDGREATVALAQRAVYDLSPGVREKAIDALQPRRRMDFQKVLLEGLRWPWKPAADHAAEAIVALKMKDLAPDLTALLKEPDPALPYVKEGKGTFVKELVQLNHFQNCLLCHSPSVSNQDLVRGLVPTPGQAPAPQYYAASTGQFVRADTTFLRQDFSVVQPVPNPGLWPAHQRFDYVLRERGANGEEIKLMKARQKENKMNEPYAQRDAVLFALREIGGPVGDDK